MFFFYHMADDVRTYTL